LDWDTIREANSDEVDELRQENGHPLQKAGIFHVKRIRSKQ
jgi:hypothetical protein